MGLRQRWRELFGDRQDDLEPARRLDLLTGFNVRELGGYEVAAGRTAWRRFVRSGSLDSMSLADQQRLYRYGVRLVVDLRGVVEVGAKRDRLADMPGVRYLHLPLHDINLSDPALEPVGDRDGYLARGYLSMLCNRAGVRELFSFFASAEGEECALFHCAAGMDRTGVVAMLLLGLAGADDRTICADYCYSFAQESEVDRLVFGDGRAPVRPEISYRLQTMEATLSWLHDNYGGFEEYLQACGLGSAELARLRRRLLAPSG